MSFEASDLARAYLGFLEAMRQIQEGEDAYSQGALNGQFFLSRVKGWEPLFRSTLADVIAFHGAVHHKLHWMRDIIAYAANASGSDASGAALGGLFDNNFGHRSAQAAAEHYYYIALELDPGCARALFNLGSLVGEKGDVDRAIEYFRRAAAVQPRFAPFADVRAAILLEKSGRTGEAAACWRSAAAHGHQYGQMHHRLALGLREAGELDAALAEMDHCLDCAHFYPPEFAELRLPLPQLLDSGAPPTAAQPTPRKESVLLSLGRRFAAAIRPASRGPSA